MTFVLKKMGKKAKIHIWIRIQRCFFSLLPELQLIHCKIQESNEKDQGSKEIKGNTSKNSEKKEKEKREKKTKVKKNLKKRKRKKKQKRKASSRKKTKRKSKRKQKRKSKKKKMNRAGLSLQITTTSKNIDYYHGWQLATLEFDI